MVKGRGLDWLPLLIALLLPLPFHFQVQRISHSWDHSKAVSTPVFRLPAENEALAALSCRHGASNERTRTWFRKTTVIHRLLPFSDSVASVLDK